MHIPDGFLSPGINAATLAVSGGALALSAVRVRRSLQDREIPLLGLTAAFIFAAEMLNFPVAAGTSGHFLGATLAAILLGPESCLLVMAAVLLIQCLGMADGGLFSIGSNFFNMGVVAGLGGYGAFRVLNRLLPGRRSFIVGAAAAAWLSIVAAAAACALELAVSGTSPLRLVLPAMALSHAVIGVGEAIITVAILQLLMKTRPDLIRAWKGQGGTR
jgi:cobalt/nickel transport system permease protein